MRDLLPIGSVVKLDSNPDVLIMIIGYYPINEVENKYYDYTGILYPYGLVNKNSFILFEKNAVTDILFRGYQDSDSEKVTRVLPLLVNEMFNRVDHSAE